MSLKHILLGTAVAVALGAGAIGICNYEKLKEEAATLQKKSELLKRTKNLECKTVNTYTDHLMTIIYQHCTGKDTVLDQALLLYPMDNSMIHILYDFDCDEKVDLEVVGDQDRTRVTIREEDKEEYERTLDIMFKEIKEQLTKPEEQRGGYTL